MPQTTFAELPNLVGQNIGTSDWLEITQERVNQFAEATGDHQWIHVDVEKAKATPFLGGTIAHGFLTLSLIPHLASGLLAVSGVTHGINYGLAHVWPEDYRPHAGERKVTVVTDVDSGRLIDMFVKAAAFNGPAH